MIEINKSKLKKTAVMCYIVTMAVMTVVYASFQLWSNMLIVNRSQASITLFTSASVNNYTALTGEQVFFYGNVYYYGNPVEGQTVSLFIDNFNSTLTDVTDQNGRYNITWVMPNGDGINTWEFNTTVVLP